MQMSPAILSASVATAFASSPVCASSARAADSANGPPEPIATRPSSGSITSPVPLTISEVSLSATASSASSFPKRRSVRQSLASSTAARVSWPCFSSLDSNSSNRVNASAAAPAKPASTWPSLPRRRTLRALDFITVLPRVTWPSPATTTWPLRRTETMVVAWKTLGFWLGSMRGSGVEPSGWGPVAVDATPAACVLVGAASVAPAGGRWSIVLLALRTRMGGVVVLDQVLAIKEGVDLGGGDLGVAEQFLQAAQVAGGLEHVAGRSEEHTSEVQSLMRLSKAVFCLKKK